MSNEKPILFKDDMIRAILEGRKCQSRRVVKMNHACSRPEHVKDEWWHAHEKGDIKCPYGKPGDRLWVREDFLQLMHGQVTDGRVKYCASIDPRSTGTPKNDGYWWRKRPSIHMPRWASRITLEITGIRVERLQEITLGDICKEGLASSIYDFKPVQAGFLAFEELWDSIYGQDSWDANPWVWVIEFKRIDQEAKAA